MSDKICPDCKGSCEQQADPHNEEEMTTTCVFCKTCKGKGTIPDKNQDGDE